MSTDDVERLLLHERAPGLRAIWLHFHTWDHFHRLISKPDPTDPLEVRVAHALPRDVWELIHRQQHPLLELNLHPEDGHNLTHGMLNNILARCPTLVRLSVPGCLHYVHYIESTTPFLPHLTWLDISTSHFLPISQLVNGTSHIPRLVPASGRLTHLTLRDVPCLTDRLLISFIRQNPGLTSLTVTSNGPSMLTSTSVGHIRNLSGQLAMLDLSYLAIPNLLQSLARASWPRLTHLKLSGYEISQEHLMPLVRQSPRLAQLELPESKGTITDDLLRSLAEACSHLKLIDLSHSAPRERPTLGGMTWLLQHYPQLEVRPRDVTEYYLFRTYVHTDEETSSSEEEDEWDEYD